MFLLPSLILGTSSSAAAIRILPIATGVVWINLMIDLLYAYLGPRLRDASTLRGRIGRLGRRARRDAVRR